MPPWKGQTHILFSYLDYLYFFLCPLLIWSSLSYTHIKCSDPVFQIKEERNGYIYCGPTLIGVFSLVDTCRSGALEAIEELNLLGVRTVMLTGDSTQAAKYAESQVCLQ